MTGWATVCLCAIALGAAISCAGGRSALSQQSLPGAVDPGRLQQQLTVPRPKKTAPRPEVERRDSAPPPKFDAIRFVLRGISLSGVTVYDSAALQVLFQPYLGREVRLSELYEIAGRITARYRDDGYILSRAVVPPQDIVDGVAEVQVIEGFVDRLILSGDIGGNPALLQAYGQKIVDSRPLSAAVLERYLLLLQDLPGVSARAVLRPSSRLPGASDLVLLLGHDPITGLAQVDNLGSRFVGPWQSLGAITLNSVFGYYGTTDLQVAAAPDSNEMRMAAISQSLPIGSEGTRLTLSAANLLSKPGSFLEPLELKGTSQTARLQLSHPIVRGRVQNLTGLASFDLLNSRSRALDVTISEDRVRSVRVALGYDLIDAWFGFNSVRIEGSRGMEILGARGSEAPDLSRADGRSDYEKVVVDLARVQQISTDWSLLARGRAQYAFDPLLAPEEFGFGGEFGRAYAPSEITGDHGAAASLEVRYAGAQTSAGIGWQAYGFYDVGAIWHRVDDGGQELPRQSAASAGIGARFFLGPAVTAGIELAQPLTRPPTTDRDDREKGFVLNVNLRANF